MTRLLPCTVLRRERYTVLHIERYTVQCIFITWWRGIRAVLCDVQPCCLMRSVLFRSLECCSTLPQQ